jgi:DNA-binding transcriptional ArsR family regulator
MTIDFDDDTTAEIFSSENVPVNFGKLNQIKSIRTDFANSNDSKSVSDFVGKISSLVDEIESGVKSVPESQPTTKEIETVGEAIKALKYALMIDENLDLDSLKSASALIERSIKEHEETSDISKYQGVLDALGLN